MKKEVVSSLGKRMRRGANDPSSSEEWIVCASKGLDILFLKLLRLEKPSILDIGAISGSSLQYMASLGFKVYADNILELGFTGALPYKSFFFDGVLIWEAIVMFDRSAVKKFLEEIDRILKPGGLGFLVLPSGEKGAIEQVSKFRIKKRNIFEYSPREEILLKKYNYSNRDLTNILKRFEIINFSLLKTGGREILIQKR